MSDQTQEFRTPNFKTADYLAVARGYHLCTTDDPRRCQVVVVTKSGAMHLLYEGDHDEMVQMRDLLARSEDEETWAG